MSSSASARPGPRAAIRPAPTHPPRSRSILCPRWRWLRSGGFAALAGQIAIAGHVVGGGHAPNLPLLVALTAALAAATSSLAGDWRTFRQLLVGMAGVQVAFHLLLGLSDHHGLSPEHPERMFAFHAVAAVIGAALLAYGDAMLFSLVSWFRRLLPASHTLPPVVGRPALRYLRRGDRPQPTSWSPLQRRGPPAAPAFR
jgi:hypothetical protein